MTWKNHVELIRKSIVIASSGLMLAVVIQLIFGLDFRGLPFLCFGVLVGMLGMSLPLRWLWAKVLA